MLRLNGYLWKLLTYKNQTTGDPCQEKVQTHLLSEKNLLHVISKLPCM